MTKTAFISRNDLQASLCRRWEGAGSPAGKLQCRDTNIARICASYSCHSTTYTIGMITLVLLVPQLKTKSGRDRGHLSTPMADDNLRKGTMTSAACSSCRRRKVKVRGYTIRDHAIAYRLASKTSAADPCSCSAVARDRPVSGVHLALLPATTIWKKA